MYKAEMGKPVKELGGALRVEENLNRIDKLLEGVGEFVMPLRSQCFTRQALAMLGFPRVSSAAMLRPAAVRCIQRQRKPLPRTTRRTVEPPAELPAVLAIHGNSATFL